MLGLGYLFTKWLAMFLCVTLTFFSTVAGANELPVREGPRPQTTRGVPHIQIGVESVPEIDARLLDLVARLPGVVVRPTVISLPGAKGFWITEDVPLVRSDAIVGGREFAHVHPDGSLHASLEKSRADDAVEAGWAIAHPWASSRRGWDGFVMIYTPTSRRQLEAVFQLVVDSYNFVTGRDVSVDKILSD